jgi:hypothetical protein
MTKFFAVTFTDITGLTKQAGVRTTSEAQVRKYLRENFGSVTVVSMQKIG